MSILPDLALFDSLSASAALLDVRGRVMEVNRAWRRFAEENGLRLPGHGVGADYLVICEHARGAYAAGAVETAHGLRGVLEGQRPSFHLTYPCHGPDQRRWYRLDATPLENGSRHGAMVAHVDVTEHVMQARLLAAQRLEAANRVSQGVVRYGNDLLTVVMGYASMLEAQPVVGDAPAYVSEILRATENGASLMSDLSAFCGGWIAQPQPLDLNSLAEHVQQQVTALLPRNVQLRLLLDAALGRVRADPQHVRRVIYELLRNAADAMPQGGTITLSTRNESIDFLAWEQSPLLPPGEYVALSVRDTGPGMSQEAREHVFEPFYTTHDAERRRGLGLAVAYGVVRSLGGHILVESGPGRGSTFRVLLPREVPA